MPVSYTHLDVYKRQVLWNAVEEAEKSRDCRLAREIEVALPQELSLQENIRLVQDSPVVPFPGCICREYDFAVFHPALLGVDVYKRQST